MTPLQASFARAEATYEAQMPDWYWPEYENDDDTRDDKSDDDTERQEASA